MRYRKSITISKGLRVNLSKSGPSITMGMKGLSVNAGKNGVYLNTGIPGTGLYDRKKITGKKQNTPSARSADRAGSTRDSGGNIRLNMDENGKITFYQFDGTELTDPSEIAAIKRTPEYKEVKARMMTAYQEKMEARISEHNQAMEDIIHINRHAEAVKTREEWQHDLDNLQPQHYTCRSFSDEQPDREAFEKILTRQAEENIRGKFGRKRKIQEYVNARLDPLFQSAMSDWQSRKKQFDLMEQQREQDMNAEYEKSYRQVKELYSKALAGDLDAIRQILDVIIRNIELPVEFSLQYEVYSEGRLFVDLDLPEIEDLPTEKFTRLKSGLVKQKEKTQKEIKQDYVKCVFGIAVYFSSLFFNVTPAVQEICISGYTQRRNRQGDLEDNYVYSVVFTREKMQGMELTGPDPAAICMNFKNRCNITTTYLLKKIVPYSIEDLQ